MQRIHRWSAGAALALGLSIAAAQSGGGFSITHSTLDPGGAATKGGAFAMTATVGQPATSALGAGTYQLVGGFNAAGNGDVIFSNGFEP
jgi:hypothetical protein